MAKTYAEKLVQLQLLIDGLKEFKDTLPAGISEESITNLENLKVELETLNSKQESAKAEVKRLTDLINKKT
ncbi:MAG: membrane-binding protein, partial [Capnocytophaga felis]|nr:membrane-binding protein [Capnocytophaga felis]